jgi:peptidoglycan hydrolase-like protein with peptidoglycan-binding domain
VPLSAYECLPHQVRGFDERVDLDVVMLQQKLQLVMGEHICKVDGVYGPRTEAAVQAFMAQSGLSLPELRTERTPSDGAVAGTRTEGAVAGSAGASATPVPPATPVDSAAATPSSAAGVRAAGASSVQPSRRPLPKPAPASSRTQLSPVGEAFLRELYLSELEARALHAASAAASTSAVQVVVDEDIKMLQLFLNEVMGRELVKPDGVYGPRTRQAVLDFQSRFGMPLGGDVAEQLRTVRSVLHRAAKSDRQTVSQFRQSDPKATPAAREPPPEAGSKTARPP